MQWVGSGEQGGGGWEEGKTLLWNSWEGEAASLLALNPLSPLSGPRVPAAICSAPMG